ncbi:hypothetical protein GCM10019060_03350 [Novosphingobium pokkalii]|nr:hypothetical protein GCM10019060_03350 [Novosphingobium pokkalii]
MLQAKAIASDVKRALRHRRAPCNRRNLPLAWQYPRGGVSAEYRDTQGQPTILAAARHHPQRPATKADGYVQPALPGLCQQQA